MTTGDTGIGDDDLALSAATDNGHASKLQALAVLDSMKECFQVV